ncbi:hypothetical protein [Rubrobacter calidifluminis]|uniref:hypothetical protein n=1 Tax=Rubrobacter calidifluminis TaxID=1392640 RepID=UPI0023626447|nr:hypothetical protein [Rubrobacter calidifluminis]
MGFSRQYQGAPEFCERLFGRREFLKLGSTFTVGALLVGALPGKGEAQTAALSGIEEEFTRAAARYRLPVELLLAMGYVNTRWEMPPPAANGYREGDPDARGVYGIMALVQNPSADTLGAASRLTGLSRQSLVSDRFSNILGGAALLASSQGSARPVTLAGWYGAVAGNGGGGISYSATAGVGGGELYAAQVFGTLQSGASKVISTGESVTLEPQEVS